ncbi:flagellar hook-length control protein FliK [Amphibacillus indicireducens]|uniref:Flagellar hook-length control protein-like C-terminal domain-containing protein n=1 Tax=Amphibacillus indicireducens TaxID=1076330 RepID=A0ABP7V5L2_9BACI
MNMNVVFFQQTATIDQQNLARSTAIADGSFRQLIGQATSETPIVADVVSLEKTTEENVNQLLNWLEQLPEDDLAMLINWFETEFNLKINNLQQLVTGLSALDVSKIELDRELIQELVNVLTLNEESEQDSSSEMISTQTPIIPIETYLATIEKSESSRVSHRVVAESINQVLNQFEDFSQNDAKQLLDLLKQMQATKEPISVVLDQLATQEADQSKLTTFAKVYENFLKKTTLADKTSYHSNTTVTSKDVLKWVRATLEQVHSTTEEQANTFGQMFSQQRTDSSVEQLQIQLGQSVETAEQVNEQLLSQFEKAISQSRFIQNLSGNNQLLLKLAPKSLGTIMVELTEIDGEMLVKLTASSQMAKEALEANIRELRHMFAPHNIVIEKQEAEPIFVEQPSPYEDMPDEQESHEQNQQSSQTEQIDRDEETIRFEDLLYQERV